MRPRYLHHVTLTTGHVARTTRADVTDVAVDVCRALLRAALAGDPQPIPGVGPAYEVVAHRHGGRCVLATVMASGEALVTIGVAGHSRCGSALWRELHATSIVPLATADEPCPPEPWCAARLDGASAERRWLAAMDWIGDFERCLAWAALDLEEPAHG